MNNLTSNLYSKKKKKKNGNLRYTIQIHSKHRVLMWPGRKRHSFSVLYKNDLIRKEPNIFITSHN